MKKPTILLCLFITSLISKAKVNEIVLTDAQIKSIFSVTDSIKSNDTLAYKKIWNTNSALSVISFDDFMSIIQLKHPLNKPVYIDSIQLYKRCSLISKELVNKIISDVKSESAEEKLKISNLLRFEKGEYFENNLNYYLQNQIFDFYYNNKVISYLRNEEYVKLLKPKAVYKLLSDTKTEDKLENEILFIAKNSKYKIN